MSRRREFTRNQREQIVKRATNAQGQICCEGCGEFLKRGAYEIDHRIPEALRPDKKQPLTIAEGQLLGKACCHRGEDGKTAKDVKQIAKAKRQASGHLGIKSETSRPLKSRNTFPQAKAKGEKLRLEPKKLFQKVQTNV